MIGYTGWDVRRTQQVIKILMYKGENRKTVRAVHLLFPHLSPIYKARVEHQTYITRIKNCNGVQRFSVYFEAREFYRYLPCFT